MFENIGIGGVLKFESGAAVSNMTRASGAFAGLTQRADRFKHSISSIGSGLSALNPLGRIGALLGGISLGAAVKEGIEFNKEMQSSKIAIATITSAITKTPMAQNIDSATKAMDRLLLVVAKAPGTLQDTVQIYQMMIGPMMAAGAKQEDIFQATQGTQIMAGALHLDYTRAAHAMSLLAGGTMRQNEMLIRQLHSMGLLHESTKQWAALLPQQRLKRIQEILSSFNAAGDEVGHSFLAMEGTLKTITKLWLGAFTDRLFKNMSRSMAEFNDKFLQNKDVMAQIRAFGDKVADGVTFFIVQVKKAVVEFRGMVNFLVDRASAVSERLNEWGIRLDMGVLKKLVAIGAQIATFSVLLSPVLTIVGFLGSKLYAVFEIVSGLGGIIMSVVGVPLLIVAGIAGALFLLFRQTGESVNDTLGRALAYTEGLAWRLYNAFMDIFADIQVGFDNIRATGGRLWDGIQPGVNDLRAAIQGVIELVVRTVELLAPIIGSIIVGATEVFEALRPGIVALFNAVAKVIRVVVDGFNYLMPKIMAVLGPIVDVFIEVATHVAAVLSRIWTALADKLSFLGDILNEVVFPVLGWIVDVFGPVMVAIFQAVGWVLDKILTVIGWIFDGLNAVARVVQGAVLVAFHILGAVISTIGGIIDTVLVGPLKFVAGVIGDIVGALGDAIGAVGDFFSGIGSGISSVWDDITDFGEDAVSTIFGIGDAAEISNKSVEDMFNNIKALETAAKIVNIAAKMQRDIALAYAMDAIKTMDKVSAEIDSLMAQAKLVKVLQNVVVQTKEAKEVNLKAELKMKSCVCVDGREIASANSKHQLEIQERAGSTNAPWQTRRVQIAGVKP